jgi:hypothetical protein
MTLAGVSRWLSRAEPVECFREFGFGIGSGCLSGPPSGAARSIIPKYVRHRPAESARSIPAQVTDIRCQRSSVDQGEPAECGFHPEFPPHVARPRMQGTTINLEPSSAEQRRRSFYFHNRGMSKTPDRLLLLCPDETYGPAATGLVGRRETSKDPCLSTVLLSSVREV